MDYQPLEIQKIMKMTLPTDSAERKRIPLYSGVLKYCAAALAGVARISVAGNDKHNPGQPLHHARGKSSDHADCIVRHAVDIADIEAVLKRELPSIYGPEAVEALLNEASQLSWRSLMWSQELHEKYGGAPLAAGAVLPPDPVAISRRAQPAPTEAHGSMRVADLKNNPRSVDLHGAHPEFDTAHHPV